MKWLSLLPGLVLAGLIALPATAESEAPLSELTTAWREDPIWHDGKAEIAVYEATRVIYGQPRTYDARLMTNFEHASPKTFTKAPDGKGRAVFKHHLREDIPTRAYTYHYSTMAYVGTEDLKSLKIDMGSMEDCGATFKQIVNHAGELTWRQFSYFPNEGRRAGSFEPSARLVFHDALTLVLRGFPFKDPQDMTIEVLPDQTDTHLTPVQPVAMEVTYGGVSTLDLPAGRIRAHQLTVTPAGETEAAGQYWFAADGSAPWLHALVQYQDGDGTRYRLKSLTREAYWRK
ncbi:MAG: hypothetical protein R3336_03545 [Phycisphaeraceae bacterium]|nr:hypothetical protein [Phycisphaeraceae bacterium]